MKIITRELAHVADLQRACVRAVRILQTAHDRDFAYSRREDVDGVWSASRLSALVFHSADRFFRNAPKLIRFYK